MVSKHHLNQASLDIIYRAYTYTMYYEEVNSMEVNELINLIVNNGFPVAVSAYLLIRLEKQLSSLSASINKLNSIISAKLGVAVDIDSEEVKN